MERKCNDSGSVGCVCVLVRAWAKLDRFVSLHSHPQVEGKLVKIFKQFAAIEQDGGAAAHFK